jgi:hypothetical protein
VTVRRAGDEPAGRELSNTFSAPEEGDTISFWVGPLDYTYESRTVDEHRRPDISPSDFRLIGGFRPQLRPEDTIPGGITETPGDVADTLLVGFLPSGSFPENEIDHTVTPSVQRWWVPDQNTECGGLLLPVVDGEPDPEGGVRQVGVLIQVSLYFAGQPDPRDPMSPVKAWTYAIFSDKDPDNEVEDGLESRDLTRFIDSPQNNEWQFGPNETIDIWAPLALAFDPDPYDPSSTDAVKRSIGCIVAKRMGNMTVQLRGRTTGNADEYLFYEDTRKVPGAGATAVRIGEFGRQSGTLEVECKFLVGGGSGGTPDFYWPDF